jgi:hypothetical protein
MKHVLVLALLGFFLAATGHVRGDDVKDVEKHLKTLKTSKNNSERLSAVSDLQLISSLNFAAVFPGIPVLTDVLATDKDHRVRATAALVLYNTGAEAKQAIPVCIERLKDEKEHPDVKYGAAMVLGVCGGNGVKTAREALPILKKLEQDEKAKEQSARNDKLLEGVLTAIGSITAGTKDK